MRNRGKKLGFLKWREWFYSEIEQVTTIAKWNWEHNKRDSEQEEGHI